MDILDGYLQKLNEGGFEKLPKGWDESSVKKFIKSISKTLGKGAKKEGFFDACVKRMSKHLGDGAEGFCASIKDEAFKSTYWRGKDKTPEEAKSDIAVHKNVPKHK